MIGTFDGTAQDVSKIATKTLTNIRERFDGIQNDAGVKAAFKFLIGLSAVGSAARAGSIPYGLPLSIEQSPLALVKELSKWVHAHQESLEYAQIARSAAADAISQWHQTHSQQQPLFPGPEANYAIWRTAGTGAGFCELSRMFFAKLTERYLNYFLEREASASSDSLTQRDAFAKQLELHVDKVSRHAFETAQITQSFSAGWYNRHAKASSPPDAAVQRFLGIAFAKIREELRRQDDRK